MAVSLQIITSSDQSSSLGTAFTGSGTLALVATLAWAAVTTLTGAGTTRPLAVTGTLTGRTTGTVGWGKRERRYEVTYTTLFNMIRRFPQHMENSAYFTHKLVFTIEKGSILDLVLKKNLLHMVHFGQHSLALGHLHLSPHLHGLPSQP